MPQLIYCASYKSFLKRGVRCIIGKSYFTLKILYMYSEIL